MEEEEEEMTKGINDGWRKMTMKSKTLIKEEEEETAPWWETIQAHARKTSTKGSLLRCAAVFWMGLVLATSFSPTAVVAAEEQGADTPTSASSSSETQRTIVKIEPCSRRPPTGGSNSGPANCISTASVRQVDLYMPPWTYSTDKYSGKEILERLQNSIKGDKNLEIVNVIQQDSNSNNDETASSSSSSSLLSVRSTRKFGTDEINFVILNDGYVTFKCEQVDGNDSVSDFGEQRKRLNEIRKRAGVLGVMGQEMLSADSTAQREGALGELKRFYGLQSGSGFEKIVLDLED